MNHLEQLVSEWLQYNGYFVRNSVLVGRRPKGGFEGELDVVGIHLGRDHLIHVECSLDADSKEKREQRFSDKFARGRKFISEVFVGLSVDADKLDSVAVLQFPNKDVSQLGGGRLLHTRDLIHEIFSGLTGKSPSSGAVPPNLPLLRTLQLAADAQTVSPGPHRLIEPTPTVS
ncbi:hypothetical protein CT676_27555 [Bradyrhizobium sp. MOS001]|nr:hypothetical protein CT676_27555 [Bradyrhizobium sp. MOS001]